jgi:hypothetical protein
MAHMWLFGIFLIVLVVLLLPSMKRSLYENSAHFGFKLGISIIGIALMYVAGWVLNSLWAMWSVGVFFIGYIFYRVLTDPVRPPRAQ